MLTKNVKVTYSQNDFVLSQNLEIPLNANERKIRGANYSYLFNYLETAKKVKSKAVKLNKPISIRIEVGGLVIDTAKVDISLQERMKLQLTDKGKIAFIRRFKAIWDFTMNPFIVVDENDLIEQLEAAIKSAE
jgi:hypothetical protein